MNLKHINFKQPKYIFPLVIAVPATCLIYFVTNMFSGPADTVPTDRINMNLPEAKTGDDYDKLRSMENRYSKDGNLFSAVDGFETEQSGKETLDEEEYTEDEINKIIEEAERKQKEQEKIATMQRNLSASTSRFAGSGNYGAGTYHDYGYDDDVNNRLEEIQRKSRQRMKDLLNEPDSDEEARAEANRIAREEMQRKIQEEAPSEVIKASTLQHRNFNTVNTYAGETSDSPLIKAMIDKTTKSTEGTRLRFKLLDDVIIDDIKLLKGSYLYGTVSGFGTQRVMANITSVLVGSRFLKVNLCVYDIDGMEGCHVPASSFREFVQNAAAGVAGQQIQFSNNGNSGDINPEMLALQALQNIYQAGSSALSRNIKKNKAKIKYNTIVYLINSNNVK